MAFRPQYAGARLSYDVTDNSIFSVSVTSANPDPGFSQSGTIWLGLQAQTRVGFNKTNLRQVNYTAGQKIVITIGSAARKNGEDIHKLIVVGSSTNDVSTIFRLAEYNTYENDQVTARALPVTITLSTDQHLKLNEIVGSSSNLPVGTNLIHGMGRGLTTTGRFYIYDETSAAIVDNDYVISAAIGRWLYIGTLSTVTPNISVLPGCNTSLDDIDSDTDLLVKPPAYNLAGGKSTSIKYWIANADIGITQDIPTGTRIGIDIYLNSEVKSRLFHGKLKIIFLGYVDMTTGELDTTDMLYVNEITTYIYGKTKNLILQKPLEADKAFMFEIYIECSAYEFRNLVKQGSSISIYPFFYTNAGEYTPLGILFGDAILLADEPLGRRIVPGSSRSVIALKGAGIVDNLQFPLQERLVIPNLLANTANQQIFIDGNGSCFLALPAATVPDTQAKRAVVGTVSGETSPGSFSATRTIVANRGIQVTLNHPCDTLGFGTIRASYPDVIASLDEGTFNPISVNIYLRRQSNGNIYKYSTTCLSQPSQTYDITSLPGSTSSLPSNSNPAFSLYQPGSVTTTELGTGTLPADTYDICFSYVYDGNQVTSISHAENLGCIQEIPTTAAQIFKTSTYWDIPINKTDLRNIPSASLKHGTARKLMNGTVLKDMEYNIYSTAADDDTLYFKPVDKLSTDPGRWIVKDSGLTSTEIIDLVLPYILGL